MRGWKLYGMRWLIVVAVAALASGPGGDLGANPVADDLGLSGQEELRHDAAPFSLDRGEAGTFVGVRHVVVSNLQAAPKPASQEQKPVVIPRLAPELAQADPVQTAAANAVDNIYGPTPAPMIPSDILSSFDGLDSTDNPVGLTPPDPQVAVGPAHIVEFVNIVGRITDKSGVAVGADFLLDDFFGTVPGATSSDPKIIYDDIHDRFFASYIDFDFAADFGDLFVAVSDTSDPTGGWTIYVASFAGLIPDYPGIGLTSDKFTVSVNHFDLGTLGFVGEQTFVLEKSDLLAAIPTPAQTALPVRADRFTVRPAHNLSPTSDQYLTTFDVTSGFLPATEMTVIRITGTPAAGNVTETSWDLPIISQNSPPPSVTAGPGLIDSGDFRMLEAVQRGDSVWSSASAACQPPGDGTVRSCAHMIEVETVGTPSVVQDIMFGAPGQYYSWPAHRTDSSSNLYVSFTGTHGGMFASAQVAGRLAGDLPNTISGTCLLKEGEIVHLTERWGDYLGAAVDPVDPSKIWVVGQYAKDDGDERWGTFIGSLSYTDSGLCPQKPPPPIVTCPPAGNDGFEIGVVDTNAIPCWTVVDQPSSSGSWCNQTGTVPPGGVCAGSGVTVAAPPEGLQAAMTNQEGPGSHVLYRCSELTSGPVSFELYINNQAVGFFSPPTLDFNVSPNQQFRADLVTAAGIAADPFTVAQADVLLNIYQTQPGDPPVSGYSTVTADASAFVGQNVCLRFAEVDNQTFFHAGVDNVEFDTPPLSVKVTVRAGSGTVPPGGTITIPVDALSDPAQLSSPATIQGTFTVEVEFDPALLDATACTPNPDGVFDFANCNANFDNDGVFPDVVRCTGVSTSGVPVDEISLCDIDFLADTAAPFGTSTPLVVNCIVKTDPGGVAIPCNEEDGKITIGLQGDVNCDGFVNVVDALFILQFEVGLRVDSGGCPLPPPPPDTLNAAGGDVNKDGFTNVVDALFILQCEVGLKPGANMPFC